MIALYLVKIPYEGSVALKAHDHQDAAREAVKQKWPGAIVDVTVEVRREDLRKDPWQKFRVTSTATVLFWSNPVGPA